MRENSISPNESSPWIENLALEELNMDETGIVHFNEHLDPESFLEEASLQFMEDLRDKFEECCMKFNHFRGNKEAGSTIKIFKISNTVNDFMLFRNSLKLIVARKNNGLITIGFLSNAGGVFSARLNVDGPTSTVHEIRAHIGPFNTVSFQFMGEPLNTEALIKHYLTEFIKHSAR